jgi:pyruvate dehydrogenase E2 component (dihydrolipoamide acetyltransferase)
MAISVVMPALEMAQETGKIISWLKQEGDTIVKGEPLLEIETDKIVVEIEAAADGVLAGVKSREGAEVPVGQTIAWIVAPGEAVPAESEVVVPAARTMTAPVAAPVSAPAPERPSSGGGGGARISPKARRIAQERGVDLSKVVGTGPDGSITGEDVLKAAEAPAPAPVVAPAKVVEQPSTLSTIARLMAERTTQSWTHVPHFFLVREVDASGLVNARKQREPAKFSVTDLLIALVARVLAKHPKMNASWSGEAIRLNPNVNISLAIAVEDGVVGAVIPNASTTDLAAIATQRRDLADRARTGRLRPQDITGGTFTISNLGMYGVDAFSAIITPPQAAILAVGRIADRVVAVNGLLGIRPMLTMTLSSDHRVVDGAQAAVFLTDLAKAIDGVQGVNL